MLSEDEINELLENTKNYSIIMNNSLTVQGNNATHYLYLETFKTKVEIKLLKKILEQE